VSTIKIDKKKSPQPITRAIILGEYFTCIKKRITNVALVQAMARAMMGLKIPKLWKAAHTVIPVKASKISQMVT